MIKGIYDHKHPAINATASTGYEYRLGFVLGLGFCNQFCQRHLLKHVHAQNL